MSHYSQRKLLMTLKLDGVPRYLVPSTDGTGTDTKKVPRYFCTRYCQPMVVGLWRFLFVNNTVMCYSGDSLMVNCFSFFILWAISNRLWGRILRKSQAQHVVPQRWTSRDKFLKVSVS